MSLAHSTSYGLGTLLTLIAWSSVLDLVRDARLVTTRRELVHTCRRNYSSRKNILQVVVTDADARISLAQHWTLTVTTRRLDQPGALLYQGNDTSPTSWTLDKHVKYYIYVRRHKPDEDGSSLEQRNEQEEEPLVPDTFEKSVQHMVKRLICKTSPVTMSMRLLGVDSSHYLSFR